MANVLITGAASGIGKAVKDYYLNNGHNVYALDINSIDDQDNLTSFVSDITNEESLLNVKQYFIDNNITLDLIINVAGIHKMASLVETEYSQMKKVIDINLCGTMLVNNVFHDRFGEGKIDSIVNIGNSILYRVEFKKHGIKAVDAEFNKMTLISE